MTTREHSIQMRTSKRFSALIACICLFAAPTRAGDVEAFTVFQNGDDGYKLFRIPAIVTASNGDLLAFCEARQGGGLSEIDLC